MFIFSKPGSNRNGNVEIIVMIETIKRLLLGFDLKKGFVVLKENITNISVNTISRNQEVLIIFILDFKTQNNKPTNTKSNVESIPPNSPLCNNISFGFHLFGFFNSLESTLSPETETIGKSVNRLASKIWNGSNGKNPSTTDSKLTE